MLGRDLGRGAAGPGGVWPSPDVAAGAAIAGVQTFPYVAPDHQARDFDYPQSPPVGGDHWPPSAGGVTGWLTCGTFDTQVPDEFAVHSMEHGAVWLTYRPGEDAAGLAALAALQPDYVLVSPYAGQSGAYGASTWGAQLFVDSPEDPRLEAQRALWRGSEVGFSDRDLVVLEGRTTSELGATYRIRPTAFAMVLVGKDGHTAFRSDVPVAASDLFQRIDAMPMRREEMRVRGR